MLQGWGRLELVAEAVRIRLAKSSGGALLKLPHKGGPKEPHPHDKVAQGRIEEEW